MTADCGGWEHGPDCLCDVLETERMPLLVGETPVRVGARPFPPDSASGRRLAQIAGRSPHPFEAVNLLDVPGLWFPGVARDRAEGLLLGRPDRALLLAGVKVARAFGVAHLPRLEWHSALSRRVGIIPHPSGLNRWWNDPANRRAARRFLRDTLEKRSFRGAAEE